MDRPACLTQRGVPLHLVHRGAAAADRAPWLAALGELARRHRCALHAYVLMGSHAHLLVSPAEPGSAPALLQALGGATDATPVHARRYLLACMRYIELNPVRAGLVRRAADFRWSSYRANALGHADPLLTPHPAYCALGRGPAERCAAYRAGFSAAWRSPSSAAPRAR